MSCDGRTLKACFRSASDIVLSPSEFRLEPNCSTARFYRADVGDVCLELDMSACPQSHTKVCCRANFAVIGYCRFGLAVIVSINVVTLRQARFMHDG